MQRERKLRALRRGLGDEAFTKGEEAIFFCPRPDCKHRKPKLSVNLKTDRFHCWVCEFSGKNLVPLLRYGGDSPELRDYLDEIRGPGFEATPIRQYDQPVLPEEFRSLSIPSASPYYRNAMEYLAVRGLGAEDILRWKLGYCEDGPYRHRIIVPSFDEHGELNFFTGRSFYGHGLPYKHGNFCKDIVWNDYMIDWSEPVIVTEGPFDAFKVSDNVAALQGSILNEGSQLFRKIVTSGVDTYFAMDTDAFAKQLMIIGLFVSYGIRSFYVDLMGHKDAGEMTKEEFRTARSRAIPVRSDLDALKLRVMS